MKNTAGFTNTARFRCLEDLQKDSMDLCLIYCGWEACDPGHRYGPNKRSCYVLHIVKKGKGKLEINNKIFNLSEGDTFLLAPDVEAWYEADKKEPWLYMWVGFSGLKAEECVTSAGFSVREPIRHVTCCDKLYAYVEGMLEAHQLTYENELKRNGLLMLLFSLLVHDYYTEQGGVTRHIYPGSVYVKHAIEYITFHYNEKIRINQLADYIGVNRSYLTSSFKKAVGYSPQEFLINLRTEKAKSLLKKTDKPINQVATDVGYADPLAFSKIFKQNVGVGPRAYRDSEDELVISKYKGDYKNTRPI